MSIATNIWLATAFLIVGAIAALLQAWLWRFPMVPDPSGRDPNGVSTAPRSWTAVHRVLGYIFVTIYIVLAVQMVPRLWRYQEMTAISALHAALGVLIGLLLVVKIGIIRRFQKFGKKLPLLGGSILGFSILMAGIVYRPASALSSGLNSSEPRLRAGAQIATTKCVSCHGPSKVMSRGRTRAGWREIVDEMRDRAEDRGIRISDAEGALVASYLASIRPGTADADEERNDDRSERSDRR